MVSNVHNKNESLITSVNSLVESFSSLLGAYDNEFKIIENNKLKLLDINKKKLEKERAKILVQSSNTVLSIEHSIKEMVLEFNAQLSSTPNISQYVNLGEVFFDAKDAGISNSLSCPLIIPFLGHKHLITLGDKNKSIQIMNNSILSCLEYSSANQVKLIIYDPEVTNGLASFSGIKKLSSDSYEVIHSEEEFQRKLDFFTEMISNSANIMQGLYNGVVEYIEKEGNFISSFYIFVVLNYSLNMNENLRKRLNNIIKRSAKLGLSFLFYISDDDSLKGLYPELTRDNSNIFKSTIKKSNWAAHPNCTILIPEISSEEIVRTIDEIVEKSKDLGKVRLLDLIPEKNWMSSSVDGLKFAFASKSGELINVVFDDSNVHALITGATGQGKSNLIKVIIYSLASHYSPDELQFILLDFKEGVTLAPFAYTSTKPYYLPHATVLGLDADQDFAFSVLEEVERIYKKRMMQMKPYDNYKSYRKANPTIKLPRIVVIIDEFQGLFANDGTRRGTHAAEKLLFLAKTVRAAGIHIILASQEIGSITSIVGIKDGLFSQFKLRIGLKNTEKGSIETFSLGNTAAYDLDAPGQVVINDDFGSISANNIGVIPFADDEVAAKLLKKYTESQNDYNYKDMIVFDGKKYITILEEINEWVKFNKNEVERGEIKAYLGRPTNISKVAVSISLKNEPGRNLALIGTASSYYDDFNDKYLDHPLGVLESILLQLSIKYSDDKADFIIINPLSESEEEKYNINKWKRILRYFGCSFHEPTIDEIQSYFDELNNSLGSRNPDSKPTFIFALGFERLGNMTERKSFSEAPLIKKFQSIWQNGPMTNVYSFFWWSSGAVFLEQMERDVSNYFIYNLLYYGTERVAQRIVDITSTWNGMENRAMFRDYSILDGRKKIIPYQTMNKQEWLNFEGFLKGVYG